MSEQKTENVGNEFEERMSKLARLDEKGIEPYPAQSDQTHEIGEVLNVFTSLKESRKSLIVVGRIRSKRTHGNLTFIDLEDATGRVQVAISKKQIEAEETYKPFVKLVDVGDFVQIKGTVFVTEAGQESVMAESWTLLSKALRSMPRDHFGLKDEDEQYRKRYVDFSLNPEKRDLFTRRAAFWRATRQFLEDHKFLEVETPTLEVTTGGAEARPFATHHNDFSMDMYLRISIGELWQKRLMAGGFEKTFEIGRAYRNEGSSPNHLQEFTNMEFYWAYADYNDGMDLVQEMYRFIAQEVYGTTKFEARGHSFDLADEWQKIDYATEIQKQTGVDIYAISDEDLQAKLEELEISYEGDNRERFMDSLWKYCRKNIAGPAFLVGHPQLVSPLAKSSQDGGGRSVERFQPILAGAEVGNGYSELNDPVDQRLRFTEQQKLLDGGDDEAMMPDWEFVEMLEYGMPPTCGFGFGERLFAFLENKTLREVTLFPLMKPREGGDSSALETLSKNKAEKLYRSMKTIVIADASKGAGITANAIGQLGIEIGNFSKEKLNLITHLSDADQRPHYVPALYPMTNYTGSQKEMSQFVMKCHEHDIQVFDFSEIMRKEHIDAQLLKQYAEKKTDEIDYIAVGAVVPKDFEKEFLSQLELFGS